MKTIHDSTSLLLFHEMIDRGSGNYGPACTNQKQKKKSAHSKRGANMKKREKKRGPLTDKSNINLRAIGTTLIQYCFSR